MIYRLNRALPFLFTLYGFSLLSSTATAKCYWLMELSEWWSYTVPLAGQVPHDWAIRLHRWPAGKVLGAPPPLVVAPSGWFSMNKRHRHFSHLLSSGGSDPLTNTCSISLQTLSCCYLLYPSNCQPVCVCKAGLSLYRHVTDVWVWCRTGHEKCLNANSPIWKAVYVSTESRREANKCNGLQLADTRQNANSLQHGPSHILGFITMTVDTVSTCIQ